MGVLGAFVFAAQMINFAIPATGSSGHIGGGLLLTALLGPHAAFLVIASVLTVQAFFFADGGLLALGCNIVNLGFFPAFVAYPLLYLPITKSAKNGARLWIASVAAAVVGLQMGSFAVVLQTLASGVSDLPFGSFALLMQPIHFAIGVVEGLATAAVVAFMVRARPEALVTDSLRKPLRPVLTGLLLASVLIGSVGSWFTSSQLDGLEWAIQKTSGNEEMETPETGTHCRLEKVQEKTAFLPDYGFKDADSEEANAWPAVEIGTSVSGLVGGLSTLAIAALIGFSLKARRRNE